jgi:hypothetical protein
MAFNDGDPIDAAKLGALETSISEIKSRMPQLGSSVTNIKVDNSTVEAAVVPKIYGGKTAPKKLVPGGIQTFQIDYSKAGFTAVPTSITVTATQPDGMPDVYQAYVSNVTSANAIITVKLLAGKTAISTSFYFLAIQHS